MEEEGGTGELPPPQQHTQDGGGSLPQQQLPQLSQNNDNNPSPTKRARADDAQQNNNNNNNNSGNNDDYYFDDGALDEEFLQQPEHGLEANLFGVFCTKQCCDKQPLLQARGSNLWITSEKLIRGHWDKRKCYSGKMPNVAGTHRQLMAQQILLHNRLKHSTPSVAAQMVQEIFPQNCDMLPGDLHFCINCGAFTKRRDDLKKHYGKQNLFKCSAALHIRKGTVCRGCHGFECPSAIVELIQRGEFKLPYEHVETNINQPPTTAPTNNNQLQIVSVPAGMQHLSKFPTPWLFNPTCLPHH